jgi:hypothetical protein
MLPSLAALVRDLAPASITELPTLIAVSGWTALVCSTAARSAELRVRHGSAVPRIATFLLVGAGVPIWGAAAVSQPVQALQVAGASVALMFSWEAAGVLERFVRELI